MSERDVDRLLYEAPQDDTDRKRGEDILAVVEASDKARQGPDPLLVALARGYQAWEKEERT